MKRVSILILILFFTLKSFSQSRSTTEYPIVLKTLSGSIYGTLSVPQNVTGKIPVVLLIPDSSPVDRDGNTVKPEINSNTYKLLSQDLGKNGIAVVRYDKRMIGESAKGMREENLRFEDYNDDAIGFIDLLKNDQRFSKVIIFGHGQGALVGSLASSSDEGGVNGFIAVEGSSERAEKILTDQMKSKPGFASDGLKTVLDSLRKGKTTTSVDPALYYIARPSLQYYLMGWCRFDPQKEIKKLKMPVLIIQGSTDLETDMTNGEKLKKAAKSSAVYTVIRGMNHILKDAPEDKEKNMATYKDPSLPIKPELITTVVDFVHGLK